MRRLVLVLAIVLLSGCGGTIVSQTFSNVDESLSSASPDEASASSAPPSAEADTGRFVVVSVDGAVDGPGVSLAEALGGAPGQPFIVTGVLLMDNDGVIWVCDEVAEGSPPECGQPRLRVENYAEGGAEWNIEDAELTGLQEAEGVRWFEEARLYGVIEP